jgi:hypothetical protein
MRKSIKITLQPPKPRNKALNSLLVNKAKSGGVHVDKKDKRSQNKLLAEFNNTLRDLER